jgi:hypothetical protein
MSRSACHSKAGMHVRWWDKWRLSSKQRRVAALEQRMLHMERLLEQRHAAHVDIHVDTIHVDSVSLERLMFRLGHLDIEELSGSLNLGNNFGSRVVQSDAASPDEQGGRAEKSPQPSQPPLLVDSLIRLSTKRGGRGRKLARERFGRRRLVIHFRFQSEVATVLLRPKVSR